MTIAINSGLPQVSSSNAEAAPTRRASAAPNASLRPIRPLQQGTISLSEEGMRRLASAATVGAPQAAKSDAELADVFKQRAPGLRESMPDLSKQNVVVAWTDPNVADLKSLLLSSSMSDEDVSRAVGAIDAATAWNAQVSNDPTVDLAVRKMKLDYVRDNLLPASLKAQADQAIGSYVSGSVSDLDRLSALVTEAGYKQALADGRSEAAASYASELKAHAEGTAPWQKQMAGRLTLVAGQRYRSADEVHASFEYGVAGIQASLLAQVGAWPREQDRGRSNVYSQMARIRSDWAAFIGSIG